MAGGDPSGLFPPKKGKKERASPRQRRRLRKVTGASGSRGVDDEVTQTTRWVRVAPFVPPGIVDEDTQLTKSYNESNDESTGKEPHLVPRPGDTRTTTTGLETVHDHDNHGQQSGGSCRDFPESSLTPTKHILPASFLSLVKPSVRVVEVFQGRQDHDIDDQQHLTYVSLR